MAAGVALLRPLLCAESPTRTIDYVRVFGLLTLSPASLRSGQHQGIYVPNEHANGEDSFEFRASECVPRRLGCSWLLFALGLALAIASPPQSTEPHQVAESDIVGSLSSHSCPGDVFRQSPPACPVVRFDITPVNDVPFMVPGATINLFRTRKKPRRCHESVLLQNR
jgi:hypothetical protein